MKRQKEIERDRIQRTCDDQNSFDLGYDWAQDQLGKGLIADCNYLYENASTQRDNIDYLCFCKGVNYWLNKNQWRFKWLQKF